MIELTIDRKKIKAQEPATILEVARANGIHIPTLCHHARLSPVGSCRVCLVEVDGATDPVASCITNVRDGMKVKTDSARIRKMRRAMVELVLIDHPLECPVCDKAGECELQDIVYELGLTEPEFDPVGLTREINEINHFIGRYPNRCVLCGRCVRACEELQGAGVMSYVQRHGYAGEIAVINRGTIECEQCGQCLRVCPVGALIEQNFKYTGRVWEMAKTATTCPYCGVGCTITLNVKQGRIHRVTSDSEGLTEGNLCVRGRFGIDFVTSDARLDSPMIRINSKQKKVSWDKALDLVAETFAKAKKKAAGSVAVLGSPRCTNEDNYQLAKFARECLGTKNIDFSDRAAYAQTLDGIADVVGVATAATNSLSAVARAEAILVLDADVSESNPQFATKIQDAVRRGGAHLTVADGRRTKLARYATDWLPITPGSEAIVLGVIVRRVCGSGNAAAGLNAKKISELAASLDDCSLEAAAEMSGVEAERIAAAADTFARAGSGAVIISGLAGRGVGTLAADLAALTGNIGEAGGVYVTGLPNNWQGAVDMGMSPAGKGLSAAEIIQAAANGKIKALYVMGDNPLGAFPGAAEALAKVDFLVVQDILSGPLTDMADVVLPAAAFAEKRGTFTNMERRVQRVRPAVRPVGEARSDVQVLADLAGRMGAEMVSGAAEVMAEIAGAVRHYKHINYEALEAGPMWWPASKKHERGASALTSDVLGKGFPTLVPAEFERAVSTDGTHIYRLVVGAKRFVSGRASRFAQGLRDVYPEPLLEMSPADAAELGVKDLAKVAVRSPHACVEVRVKITPKSLPGTVFLPAGLDEAPVGELLGHNGAARATKAAVSIEKVQGA